MLRGEEKQRNRIATEVMAEYVEGGDGIAEAPRDVFGALSLDEECSQGLVLALFGGLRLEKEMANLTYVFWCSHSHRVTLSHSTRNVNRKNHCHITAQTGRFLGENNTPSPKSSLVTL